MKLPRNWRQLTVEEMRAWIRKDAEGRHRRWMQRIHHPSHKRTIRLGGSRFDYLRPQGTVYRGDRYYVRNATVGQVKKVLGRSVRRVRRAATGEVEVIHSDKRGHVSSLLREAGFSFR